MGARWIQAEVAVGRRLALGAGSISVLGFERQTQVISLWNQT
jgi:probable phosphoglycerate mutase